MASCRLFTCLILFRALSAAAPPLLSPAQYEGKRVASVRFEPSPQPLAARDLQAALAVKTDAPLRLADIRATIKHLYASGRYANIDAYAERAGAAVNVVFRTTPQWFNGPVEVNGKVSQPPNRGQLENASQLQLGEPFDEPALNTAIAGLQDALRRNGFYEATVEPVVQRDPAHQQVSFSFIVHPGKRARLIEPEITGHPILPPAKVAKAARFRSLFHWKQDTEDNLQFGLKRIETKYQKQDRLAAKVGVTGMQYDAARRQVKPVINVEGGPKIKFETTGAKVSQKKLKQYVPVFDEKTVNRDLVVEGARNLRDYLQTQGYFDVQVDFRILRPNPDRADIEYIVTPGSRHKLVGVEIRGNHYFRTEDIRERMFLQPAGTLILRHGRYSQGFVQRDHDAIQALYQSNGFRDVKIAMQSLDDYRGKKGEMLEVVNIEEGPQYRVSGFALDGVRQLNRRDLTSGLTTVPGEPFSEYNVALDRDYILAQYQSAGYPDATFDWRMQPGPGPHQVKVEYIVAEGQRRYVKDVLITGLHTTRMRLVQPSITIQAGDPLSLQQMASMQRSLYNLGVFDKVDMAVQNPDGQEQDKYVLYHLEEGDRYSVAVGLGAEFGRIGGSQTSFSNPAGQTGFSPRGSFEVSRLNLWGLGHSLNFKSSASTLEKRALLNYSAPHYRDVEGRNISITALYDDSRDVRTFAARRLEGSAQLSQKYSKATTFLWRFTYRRVNILPGTLKINPIYVPLLSQPERIGMLSGSLINDRRDDPTDAHKGMYTTLDFGLASHVFGGTTNFPRLLATNSSYHRIHGNWVLARRLQFGLIQPFHTGGLDPSVYVPIAERFFSGGSTSLRAFPDNQAGPRDPLTGFPLGGNVVLIHNTEIRFPFLSENMQGVIFHDMGNVFDKLSDVSFRFHQQNLTDFSYLVHAVGFGIRYRTPVGPVRLDLAYSINPPSFMGFQGTPQQLLTNTGTRSVQNISHFQFFFSIGQAF